MFLGSPQVGIKGNRIMPIMSIGQVAEILTMAILGRDAEKARLAHDDDAGNSRARRAFRRVRLFPAR